MTREVYAPKGRYPGRHKVYCTVYRDWNKLCQNRPGPMRRCYTELADNPFPPMQTNRHHQLKGKLKGFWEYEVDGGARVRYKRGPGDRVVVLTAAPTWSSSRGAASPGAVCAPPFAQKQGRPPADTKCQQRTTGSTHRSSSTPQRFAAPTPEPYSGGTCAFTV